MKKAIVFALMVCLAAFSVAAYGQQQSNEDEYKDMTELRHKLVRMKREMDTFMRELARTYDEASLSDSGFGQNVKIDVSQTPGTINVKADIPGMNKDKLEVTLQNDKFLKISGSREIETEKKSEGVVQKERMSGYFERVVELPASAMSDGIKASYKDGVLDVTLPKKTITKEEQIKIKVQ